MGQLITLLFTIFSLAGIAFILYRKIPMLLEFPSTGETGKDAILNVVGKAKVQPKKVLRKTAIEARKLAQKTERSTTQLAARLQQETGERQEEFQKSYWDKLGKKGKKKN